MPTPTAMAAIVAVSTLIVKPATDMKAYKPITTKPMGITAATAYLMDRNNAAATISVNATAKGNDMSIESRNDSSSSNSVITSPVTPTVCRCGSEACSDAAAASSVSQAGRMTAPSVNEPIWTTTAVAWSVRRRR